LINSFVVAPDRDDAFLALWTETSMYFRARPGFISLRLHRAVSPDAHYRFVNVAVWESAAQFSAAHETEEFRRLVRDPRYREFPSSPALYQVAVAAQASAAAA
jgi:heme-degrading monooxygenase HmoA